MEEGRVEHRADAGAGARSAARGRRGRLPLYLLAAVGAVAVAAGLYRAGTGAPAPAAATRPVIDEAAVIDRVMTEHYGKYSKAQRGWLFVGDDDRTYVMRVIQKARMAGAGGDELYFMASGAPINDEPDARLGAFHVRPDPARPGRFLTRAAPSMPGGTFAVQPENVRFEAFSTQLKGWVVEVREGYDGEDLWTTDIVLLAPRGKAIVELAAFPAARDYDAGDDCGSLGALRQEVSARAASAGAETPGTPEAETVEIHLCQQRRWTYRLGSAKGGLPAPISVSAGGTLDGRPVAPRTWTLPFDAQAQRYTVPKELKEAAY